MTDAGYARRSKEEAKAGRDVHSIELQFEWAEREAGTTVKRFKDDGISGGLGKRPGLTRLVNAVRARRVDRIFVYASDRLARNLRVAEALAYFFVSHGTELHIPGLQPMKTEYDIGLVFQILSSVAEHERRETGRKSKDGVRMAKKKGKKVGRPPTGFTVSEDGLHYELLPWAVNVAANMDEVSAEELALETGKSTSTVKRAMPRIRAWQDGGQRGVDILRREWKVQMKEDGIPLPADAPSRREMQRWGADRQLLKVARELSATNRKSLRALTDAREDSDLAFVQQLENWTRDAKRKAKRRQNA